MLAENTGRALCDSGGEMQADGTVKYGYGRNWERNQGRDFDAEQETVLQFDYDYISITHNVYHWLASRLSFDADLTEEFEKFAEATEERKDSPWLQLMEEWAGQLGDTEDEDGEPREVSGLYGDGEPFTVNTYNGEDLLSQTIQYTYFELNGDAHVLLQVHGGCDVRGGYTAPKVFQVSSMAQGDEGTQMFDNARATVYCNGVEKNPNQTEIAGCEVQTCEMYWDTDDGCHFYAEGAAGYGADTQLEDYPQTKEEDEEEWTQGHLHILENGDMLCPVCGGKLGAHSF